MSRVRRRSSANGLQPRGTRSGERGPVGRIDSLDDIDRGLIEALQSQGRESFRNIARQLGTSEATVRNRYARLVDINLLQVTGITNPLGVGFEAMAMIGVKTNGPAQGSADELSTWKEVSYVVITMGGFDLLVEVVCVDRAELLEVTERIRSLPSVVSTETFGYLNLVKQIVNWGVPIGDGRHGS